MALLEVKNLHISFKTRKGKFKAVRGVSFSLEEGEIHGIVGESGSGKSVTSYSILSLLPKRTTIIEKGEVLFNGTNILNSDNNKLSKIRGSEISMIFQDPMTSLNPFLKISTQLIEPLIIHKGLSKKEALVTAIEALKEAGIPDPERRINQYPHQFSGGMRQRVMIAMALITKPKLLIADEPTTALDVTIQAQILELIKKLQKNHNTSVIFITHDLGIIASLAHRISVMYAGEIIESGNTEDIFYTPKHPYTEALLDSIPAGHLPGETLYSIPGHPPEDANKIKGCLFNARCRYVKKTCHETKCKFISISDTQMSSCTLIQEKYLEIKKRGRS